VKVGRDLARSDHPVDPDLMRRGLDDALAGHAALDEGEVDAAPEDYGRFRSERLESARARYAEETRQYAHRFLEENGAREDVVVLESGLQYEVLREGKGSSPSVNDFVTCHYRGTLPDGRIFDDTFAGGEPRIFNVSSVVDGLEQGLQLMRPGARWKLYLPPELAYGASGLGRDIPPHAALVFEIELIAVEGETPPFRG
jgi:FKBP-type peptidyl-prolyl cis-trans isomerase